jgi:hypothetical protein
MGIARADGQVTQPIGTAPDGTQIFERRVAHGFFLIVEAAAGQSRRPPGLVTFNSSPSDPNRLPNLQIVVSRALGNGSGLICDDGPETPIGGVPAVDPPVFGGVQSAANAINDFACRFDARDNTTLACTRDAGQDSRFVNAATRVQYCPFLGIGSELAFLPGDTRVTARVTDDLNQPGMPRSIIVRFTP